MASTIAIILTQYWDVLVAIGIFTTFFFKMKYGIDFIRSRLDYEINRLREYVDIKNNHLYENIADIKKSIDAIGEIMNVNASKTTEEIRLLSGRIDKFFEKKT